MVVVVLVELQVGEVVGEVVESVVEVCFVGVWMEGQGYCEFGFGYVCVFLWQL